MILFGQKVKIVGVAALPPATVAGRAHSVIQHRGIAEILVEHLLQHTAPDDQQAEACFRQALAIARRQQARSLELRAAMSLSRLWQQQNKRQEAHDLLAPVYNWFTEGFDTADLQDAKALLGELS